jgi:hypothetical protein
MESEEAAGDGIEPGHESRRGCQAQHARHGVAEGEALAAALEAMGGGCDGGAGACCYAQRADHQQGQGRGDDADDQPHRTEHGVAVPLLGGARQLRQVLREGRQLLQPAAAAQTLVRQVWCASGRLVGCTLGAMWWGNRLV